MEHAHTCVYCGVRWSCSEDCPFAGGSACEACRHTIVPNAPRRVIPLRHSWVLDHLTEHTAERLRRIMRRRS